MRPLVVQLVRRRLWQNERRRRFAAKMVRMRRTRWLRAAWRWLAAPAGVSRGWLAGALAWFMVAPLAGAVMDKHRAGTAMVVAVLLEVLVVWVTARLAWVIWRRRRRRRKGRHG